MKEQNIWIPIAVVVIVAIVAGYVGFMIAGRVAYSPIGPTDSINLDCIIVTVSSIVPDIGAAAGTWDNGDGDSGYVYFDIENPNLAIGDSALVCAYIYPITSTGQKITRYYQVIPSGG